MSSFYTALKRSHKEIRLLHLEPDRDPSSPVSCSLRTVSLFENPPYTALSYCWGESADNVKITLNGVPDFSIPRNLDSVLRRLRHETEVKTLWTDAICINQDPNSPEKNHQVAMMREIYAHANPTIIWLGETGDGSDLAMETISQLYKQSIWQIEDNTLTAAQFNAIAALNARPWWSRVWVIQELLLSPKPIVMCGTKSAPIEAFIHLDDLRQGYHRPSGKTIDNAAQPSRFLFRPHPFSQILHHYFNDKRRVQAGVVNLEEWVVIIENFHATDPRDKMYELLGLGSEEDRLALPPDYSSGNTVADVYSRATAHFMLQRQDLLHLQFNTNDVDPALRLPSWCSDYSCQVNKVKERYVAFVVGSHDNANFSSSGTDFGVRADLSMLKDELFPKHMEGNWRELHVRGWTVDEVVYASINPYMPPYTGNDAAERAASIARRAEQTKSNIRIWEAEARQHLSVTCPYAPRTVDEVFWRTLMANRDFAWNPVLDTWKEYFDVWLDRKPLPFPAAHLAVDEKERKRLYVKPFTDAAITRPHGRAFIITKKGYLGLAPRKARVGDVVSILKGGSVPFILRRKESKEKQWELVGESFVMGLMDGEGIVAGRQTVFVIV